MWTLSSVFDANFGGFFYLFFLSFFLKKNLHGLGLPGHARFARHLIGYAKVYPSRLRPAPAHGRIVPSAHEHMSR